MKSVASIAMMAFVAVALGASEWEQFQSWRNQHKRVYATQDEEMTRFENFKASLMRIKDMNSKRIASTSAWFGLNDFADYTVEEYKGLLGFKGAEAKRVTDDIEDPVWPKYTADQITKLPASKDWRDDKAVNDVKNQAQCGSCWAFSTIANLEGQWVTQAKKDLGSFSEQQLVGCDKNCGKYRHFPSGACDGGCGGGLMSNAYKYFLANNSDTEAQYPYTATTGACNSVDNPTGPKLVNWTFVGDASGGEEDQMKGFVGYMGPMSIAVNAMPWMHYSGGVFDGACPAQLDHGVAIVGWGTDSGKDYWLVRNSWGSSWGESGYIRIAYGTGECGIDTWACSGLFSQPPVSHDF